MGIRSRQHIQNRGSGIDSWGRGSTSSRNEAPPWKTDSPVKEVDSITLGMLPVVSTVPLTSGSVSTRSVVGVSGRTRTGGGWEREGGWEGGREGGREGGSKQRQSGLCCV